MGNMHARRGLRLSYRCVLDSIDPNGNYTSEVVDKVCNTYGYARNTVKTAIYMLKRDGYIEEAPRTGMEMFLVLVRRDDR